MIGICTLGCVGFTTRHLDAWKTFAPQVLGLQVSEELADGTLVLRADHHRRSEPDEQTTPADALCASAVSGQTPPSGPQ